jgi:hypothetical protein
MRKTIFHSLRMNSNPSFLTQVCDLLSLADIDTSLEYPGYIEIMLSANGESVHFGTANGLWAWDRLNEEADVLENSTEDQQLAADSSPEAVAAWIRSTLNFLDPVTDAERSNGR